MRVCAISVDLDEIPNYCAIHGADLPALDRHAVYDRALERLSRWSARHDVPLTLFAVGSDLERPHAASALAQMSRLGHEIGNHTQDHRYDLTRLGRAEILAQIERAQQAIAACTGQLPLGFRAPGYVITQPVYEVLSELGFRYSSSVFPCPWYYAPKALAIGWKGVFGKGSRSLVDDPRVLLAPTVPYRVGSPYYQRGAGVLELPIQVTPRLRLPFIGTSLMLAGPGGAAWLTRQLLGAPLINLELHGIDVLEASDGLSALAGYQPDLRVSVDRKLETLDRVVATVREAGYSFRTLGQAAAATPVEAATH